MGLVLEASSAAAGAAEPHPVETFCAGVPQRCQDAALDALLVWRKEALDCRRDQVQCQADNRRLEGNLADRTATTTAALIAPIAAREVAETPAPALNPWLMGGAGFGIGALVGAILMLAARR